MERPVVVLNHVWHLVSIPVLLQVIVVQICLDIATVSVKPRLILPLLLVRHFLRSVLVSDLPVQG